MGLAGPKKRVKLSHDPNNTTWTRDTAGFGHKLMTAQGWQPGQYLGAKDAAHAEFHTAANASFIRVVAKDDNLGIGAKRGSGLAEGECTGLDVFQSLLGRLNGKEEDVLAAEQKSREDLKRAIYTERRWGSIRFVPGGLLVGDKIQDLIDGEANRLRSLETKEQTKEQGSSSSDSDSDGDRQEESTDEKRHREKLEKQERKELRKLRRAARATGSSAEKDTSSTPSESEPSKRKSKRESKRKRDTVLDEPEASAEKKSRKAERLRRRNTGADEKNAEESTALMTGDLAAYVSTGTSDAQATIPPPHQSSALSGRHAVRARFIAQKKAAVMDLAALNQIFMIKS